MVTLPFRNVVIQSSGTVILIDFDQAHISNDPKGQKDRYWCNCYAMLTKLLELYPVCSVDVPENIVQCTKNNKQETKSMTQI